MNHPFPKGLGAGTMPMNCFLHFLEQDYHFLKGYARTASLTAYKTANLEEMAASIVIVDAILKETERESSPSLSWQVYLCYLSKTGLTQSRLQCMLE